MLVYTLKKEHGLDNDDEAYVIWSHVYGASGKSKNTFKYDWAYRNSPSRSSMYRDNIEKPFHRYNDEEKTTLVTARTLAISTAATLNIPLPNANLPPIAPLDAVVLPAVNAAPAAAGYLPHKPPHNTRTALTLQTPANPATQTKTTSGVYVESSVAAGIKSNKRKAPSLATATTPPRNKFNGQGETAPEDDASSPLSDPGSDMMESPKRKNQKTGEEWNEISDDEMSHSGDSEREQAFIKQPDRRLMTGTLINNTVRDDELSENDGDRGPDEEIAIGENVINSYGADAFDADATAAGVPDGDNISHSQENEDNTVEKSADEFEDEEELQEIYVPKGTSSRMPKTKAAAREKINMEITANWMDDMKRAIVLARRLCPDPTDARICIAFNRLFSSVPGFVALTSQNVRKHFRAYSKTSNKTKREQWSCIPSHDNTDARLQREVDRVAELMAYEIRHIFAGKTFRGPALSEEEELAGGFFGSKTFPPKEDEDNAISKTPGRQRDGTLKSANATGIPTDDLNDDSDSGEEPDRRIDGTMNREMVYKRRNPGPPPQSQAPMLPPTFDHDTPWDATGPWTQDAYEKYVAKVLRSSLNRTQIYKLFHHIFDSMWNRPTIDSILNSLWGMEDGKPTTKSPESETYDVLTAYKQNAPYPPEDLPLADQPRLFLHAVFESSDSPLYSLNLAGFAYREQMKMLHSKDVDFSNGHPLVDVSKGEITFIDNQSLIYDHGGKAHTITVRDPANPFTTSPSRIDTIITAMLCDRAVCTVCNQSATPIGEGRLGTGGLPFVHGLDLKTVQLEEDFTLRAFQPGPGNMTGMADELPPVEHEEVLYADGGKRMSLVCGGPTGKRVRFTDQNPSTID